MLATGLIVAYGYVFEAFFGWYSGDQFEQFMIHNRMFGPYWLFYWSLILCNIIMPQFCGQSIRTSPRCCFVISMFVNIGMWLERFVIVVTSLHRDFLPSSWGMYWPTRWDLMTFFGHHRLVRHAVLPLHPRAADDLDLRDADDGAGGEGQGSEAH